MSYRPWTRREHEYVRHTMDRPADRVKDRVHRTKGAVYMRRRKIRMNGGPPTCRDCPKSRQYEHTDEMVFCSIDGRKVDTAELMCEDMKRALARCIGSAIRDPDDPRNYEEMHTWREP